MSALIISVGGTWEAPVASIMEHKPGYVCFVASSDTVKFLAEIERITKEKGVGFAQKVFIVDDPQNIVGCYECCLRITDYLRTLNVSEEDIIVDYTGGTKTMSAALALAAVGHGYRFSYVGGSARTKGGVGVVETGKEQVFLNFSPYELLAMDQRRRMAMYFNCYQFEAAASIANDLGRKLPEPDSSIFVQLSKLIEGYAQWDRFRHREALDSLSRAQKKLNILLPALPKWNDTLTDFIAGFDANIQFLRKMQESDNFKTLSEGYLIDLLANAGRRIEEQKYDDAVARLYRMIEMVGQIACMKHFGVSTGAFPVELLPPEIKEEYCKAHLDPRSGKLKLGLDSTMNILAKAGDPTGKNYVERREEFRKHLLARNDSILAHGVVPVSREQATELNIFIRTVFGLNEQIVFPKLNW